MLWDSEVSLLCMSGIAILHSSAFAVDFIRGRRRCPNSPQRDDASDLSNVLMGHLRQPLQVHADREQGDLETKLAEVRAESYLASLRVWSHICCIYSAIFFAKYCMGMQFDGNGVMSIILAISYLTALVIKQCPSLVRKETVWLLHHWFMGLGFAMGNYMALCRPLSWMHYYPQLLLFRVSFSIAYPAALTNFCWNVVWGFVACIGTLQNWQFSQDIPSIDVVWNEAVVAAFFSYVLWSIERIQESRVRSDLQANGYYLAKKTMESLLSDMCDAVVELDANLQIRQPSPKLAGLLLRHAGTTSLQGEPFANLAFGDDDGDRFRDFVTRRTVPVDRELNGSVEQTSSSMYLDLKDSSGTPVSVQLFHSCHRDAPREVCHVVGVHEVEKHTRVGGAQDTFDENGLAALPGDDTDSFSSGVRSGGSDASITLAPLIPEKKMLSPESVIFHPMTNQIIATGTGFQSLTGPLLFKASMKEFVVNYETFRDWVHEEVNGFFANDDPTKFKIKISPSKHKSLSVGRKEAHVEFHADACIVDVRAGVRMSEMGVEQFEGTDEEQYDFLCLMVLGKPQPQWRRDKAKPRRNAETTSSPSQGSSV